MGTYSIDVASNTNCPKRGLPFVRILLYPREPRTDSKGVPAFAMLDTGSTSNLLDEEYFYSNFPEGMVEGANATLTFAGGVSRVSVNQQTNLYFYLPGRKQATLFRASFLLVRNLSFNIYLGQEFFQQRQVACHGKEGLYLSEQEDVFKKAVGTCLKQSTAGIMSDIYYLTKLEY